MSVEKKKKPAKVKKRKKFKLTNLPDSPVELGELLRKLKDKETRLEADLAIKEFPELEIGITEVVLALSDVKKARELEKVTKASSMDSRRAEATLEQIAAAEAKIDALRLMDASATRDRQISFYENRLAILKESIAENEEVEVIAEVRMSVAEATNRLKEIYAKWSEPFEENGIDLPELIPALRELLA